MSLFMETTKISPESTVATIQKLLGQYGASAILIEYQNGEVSGVSYRFKVGETEIPFRLPCRWNSIFTLLQRERKARALKHEKDDMEKSKRVAWRQILRWLEAQLALVDTGMVKTEEVFLAYIQVSPKETLFEKFKKSGWKFKQLTAGEGE